MSIARRLVYATAYLPRPHCSVLIFFDGDREALSSACLFPAPFVNEWEMVKVPIALLQHTITAHHVDNLVSTVSRTFVDELALVHNKRRQHRKQIGLR
jgi:hypothetical protein